MRVSSLGTAASGSQVINVAGQTRALIIGVSPVEGARCLLGIYSTSGGTVYVNQYDKGSYLTITAATGTVTIANSNSNGVLLYGLSFSGELSI